MIRIPTVDQLRARQREDDASGREARCDALHDEAHCDAPHDGGEPVPVGMGWDAYLCARCRAALEATKGAGR
jgi:hypothetical protein